MVGSISNVGFASNNIKTQTNARPYMQSPYQNAPMPDSLEIAGKKAGKDKKTVGGVIVAAALLAAGLFAGVKTGKLKAIENPQKWTGKLQNLAYKGGKGVETGVNWVSEKGKPAIEWIKDKGKAVVDWVKAKFAKKPATPTNIA